MSGSEGATAAGVSLFFSESFSFFQLDSSPINVNNIFL
jgi:hypothetical protein